MSGYLLGFDIFGNFLLKSAASQHFVRGYSGDNVFSSYCATMTASTTIKFSRWTSEPWIAVPTDQSIPIFESITSGDAGRWRDLSEIQEKDLLTVKKVKMEWKLFTCISSGGKSKQKLLSVNTTL